LIRATKSLVKERKTGTVRVPLTQVRLLSVDLLVLARRTGGRTETEFEADNMEEKRAR
jgi:hypothetical protein